VHYHEKAIGHGPRVAEMTQGDWGCAPETARGRSRALVPVAVADHHHGGNGSNIAAKAASRIRRWMPAHKNQYTLGAQIAPCVSEGPRALGAPQSNGGMASSGDSAPRRRAPEKKTRRSEERGPSRANSWVSSGVICHRVSSLTVSSKMASQMTCAMTSKKHMSSQPCHR